MKEVYFNQVTAWMWRNARPLEMMRYLYHFKEGDVKDVLEALAAFQNEDGGFGHALEPDAWNPHSSPIQTWAAIEIIRELEDIKEDAIINKLLHYLDTTIYYEEGKFARSIPSNDDFPHAPWWTHKEDAFEGYNPSASLTGFILRYGHEQMARYEAAKKMAKEVYQYLVSNGCQEMHELHCIIELYDDLMASELKLDIDMELFKSKLIESASNLIEKDTDKWTDYTCVPSRFVKGPNSMFITGVESLMEQELDRMEAVLETQTIWDIPWAWGNSPEAFAISRKWWQGSLAVKHLLLLKAFKRI